MTSFDNFQPPSSNDNSPSGLTAADIQPTWMSQRQPEVTGNYTLNNQPAPAALVSDTSGFSTDTSTYNGDSNNSWTSALIPAIRGTAAVYGTDYLGWPDRAIERAPTRFVVGRMTALKNTGFGGRLLGPEGSVSKVLSSRPVVSMRKWSTPAAVRNLPEPTTTLEEGGNTPEATVSNPEATSALRDEHFKSGMTAVLGAAVLDHFLVDKHTTGTPDTLGTAAEYAAPWVILSSKLPTWQKLGALVAVHYISREGIGGLKF